MIVFVGESPGAGAQVPFGPSMINRLASMVDLGATEFRDRYITINLIPFLPHGYPWPRTAAAVSARAIHRIARTGTRFVMLGRRVQAAFVETYECLETHYGACTSCMIRELDFLEAWVDDGYEFVLVPHPSGRSRWWNEKENVERLREFMRRFR